MSRLKNLLNAFVPVRERREVTGTLAANNAEVVLDLNGDESAAIYLNAGAGTWNSTVEITGSVDGTNYFPVLAFPYSPACTGGTIPVACQPLISETINTTSVARMYCVAVGQLKKLRIRTSAWVTGSATVTINSEAAASIHPNAALQRAATLIISITGLAGAAVTATMPAVAGFRHYVDFVHVRRSTTVALTASATPTVTTQANLPGAVAMTFGADAGGVGIDKEQVLDFGSTGMAAVAVNTATSITCPATTGVIWRINVAYRLGL